MVVVVKTIQQQNGDMFAIWFNVEFVSETNIPNFTNNIYFHQFYRINVIMETTF